MSEWAAASLVVGPLVVVGGLVLWWVLRSGHDPKTIRAANERFRERQKRPDFEAYRRKFGCDPPEALVTLFDDPSLFTDDRDSFTVMLSSTPAGEGWYVAWIEPIDAEHLEQQPWPGTEGLFAFANNGAGDQYLFDPCGRDPEVIHYEHESGKRRPLGVTLSAFLSAKREYEA